MTNPFRACLQPLWADPHGLQWALHQSKMWHIWAPDCGAVHSVSWLWAVQTKQRGAVKGGPYFRPTVYQHSRLWLPWWCPIQGPHVPHGTLLPPTGRKRWPECSSKINKNKTKKSYLDQKATTAGTHTSCPKKIFMVTPNGPHMGFQWATYSGYPHWAKKAKLLWAPQ